MLAGRRQPLAISPRSVNHHSSCASAAPDQNRDSQASVIKAGVARSRSGLDASLENSLMKASFMSNGYYLSYKTFQAGDGEVAEAIDREIRLV